MDDYAMPCPICGRFIFNKPGSFDTCQYCGWEDDGLQSSDHNYAGGANDLSVNEERIQYYLLNRADTRQDVREAEAIYMKECSAIIDRYAGMNHVLEPERSEQERLDYSMVRQNYIDACIRSFYGICSAANTRKKENGRMRRITKRE